MFIPEAATRSSLGRIYKGLSSLCSLVRICTPACFAGIGKCSPFNGDRHPHVRHVARVAKAASAERKCRREDAIAACSGEWTEGAVHSAAYAARTWHRCSIRRLKAFRDYGSCLAVTGFSSVTSRVKFGR
eukprot:IDg2650t1